MVQGRGDAEGYGLDAAEGMAIVGTVGDWTKANYTMGNAFGSSLSNFYLPSPLQSTRKAPKFN